MLPSCLQSNELIYNITTALFCHRLLEMFFSDKSAVLWDPVFDLNNYRFVANNLNGAFPEGYSIVPDIYNATSIALVCTGLSENECQKWISCSHAARDCCKRQKAAELSVTDHEFYCKITWNGVSCLDATPNGTILDLQCPSYYIPTDGSSVSNGHCNGNSQPESQHQFLDELYKMMVKDGYDAMKNRDSKVVEFKHPKELEAMLDMTLEKETSDDRLLQICQDVIRYSVKTGHPHFFNQLFGGLDEYSLGGAWLTETLNTSVYTFEVSPVFTVMEKALLQKMLNLIGFNDGDAIFCPGGSIANMYALNVARYKRFPDVKKTGVYGLPRLCVLTSEKGHYSMKKGMAFLGLGLENLISVKSDEKGKMDVKDLEEKILQAQSEGKVPYLVNATAGTTVFGAYDPLDKIADICEKYGLWMHVDGAWGGSALVSKNQRGLMKGIERADSMTWNPHKMMGAPLQSSAFLTRHKNLLPACHSANAAYLFQQDKFYDVSYDTGDKSIQCGRKNDSLKLWLMWKAKGDEGFQKDIDNLFECSKYLAKLVREKEGFELVVEPECTNVCFWYIPVSMRNQKRDADWWQRLGKVAPQIKEGMTRDGTMLIGYQPDGDRVNFFRMIVSNLDTNKADMQFVVDEIDRLGKDL